MVKSREELHQFIELLDDEMVDSILKIVKNLVKKNVDDDTVLKPDEVKRMKEGEAQIARGEYIEFDILKKEFNL